MKEICQEITIYLVYMYVRKYYFRDQRDNTGIKALALHAA